MTKDEQEIIRLAQECRYDDGFRPVLSSLQLMVLDHLMDQSAEDGYILNAHDRSTLYCIAKKLKQIEKYQGRQALWDAWEEIKYYGPAKPMAPGEDIITGLCKQDMARLGEIRAHMEPRATETAQIRNQKNYRDTWVNPPGPLPRWEETEKGIPLVRRGALTKWFKSLWRAK